MTVPIAICITISKKEIAKFFRKITNIVSIRKKKDIAPKLRKYLLVVAKHGCQVKFSITNGSPQLLDLESYVY